MSNYKFQLINGDPQLDISEKEHNIRAAIDYILDGKNRRKPVFIDVNDIKINNINKYEMELDVTLGERASDSWKGRIGWYLANNCNMRHFCNPDNREEMFSIKKV